MGAVFTIVILFYFVFLLLMLAFAAASYVAMGIAINKLCQKHSIEKGYWGFIPVVNTYKFGEIADVLCEKNGDDKRFAKKLMYLNIAEFVAITVYIFAYLVITITSTYLINIGYGPQFAVIFLFEFIFLAIAIVYCVFYYIALWKIYNYSNSQNSVLFLVLSIVTGIPQIFMLITAFRKNDSVDSLEDCTESDT